MSHVWTILLGQSGQLRHNEYEVGVLRGDAEATNWQGDELVKMRGTAREGHD